MILEFLSQSSCDLAHPTTIDDLRLIQDIVASLYVAVTRYFFPKSCLHRKNGRDGDFKSCLEKFGLNSQPEIEPILPSEKALLSFTQALLRRRFH